MFGVLTEIECSMTPPFVSNQTCVPYVVEAIEIPVHTNTKNIVQ
jgi:hypothetical protein